MVDYHLLPLTFQDGEAITLHVFDMSEESEPYWFVVSQELQDKGLGARLSITSKTAWYKVMQGHGVTTELADKPLLAILKSMGVISKHTAQATMLSFSSFFQICQRAFTKSVAGDIVALECLVDFNGRLEALEDTSKVIDSRAWPLNIVSFPSTFEAWEPPHFEGEPYDTTCNNAMHNHYGLLSHSHAMLREPLLQQQFDSFADFCKVKVNLDRGWDLWEDEETFHAKYKRLTGYLGFIVKYKSVDKPHLGMVCQGAWFSEYLMFLIYRGVANLKQHCHVARKVCVWLKAKKPNADHDGLFTYFSKLEYMQYQLKGVLRHKPNPQKTTIVEKHKSIFKDVGEFFNAKVDVAFALLQAGDVSLPAAAHVHDAFLAHLMFGGHVPMRPKMYVTLMMPWYDGPCSDVDCDTPGCRGNHLELDASGAYVLSLIHSKNDKHKNFTRETFTLSPNLQTLAKAHVDWGHSRHMAFVRSHAFREDQHGHVFMHQDGMHFQTSNQFNRFFQEQLLKGCVFSCGIKSFAPKWLRQVFISSYMHQPETLLEEDKEFVASAMQTSVRKLNQVYDLGKKRRAQANVGHIPEFWAKALKNNKAVAVPGLPVLVAPAPPAMAPPNPHLVHYYLMLLKNALPPTPPLAGIPPAEVVLLEEAPEQPSTSGQGAGGTATAGAEPEDEGYAIGSSSDFED